MSLPLVSIVIPAYKIAHFEVALKSALGQSYPNIEIIVSDDSPGPEIEAITRRYPSVKYLKHDKAKGFNQSISLFLGQGAFVKPLFDDDVLHPFCVEMLMRGFSLTSDVNMIFSASAEISINNDVLRIRRPFQQNRAFSSLQLRRLMVLNSTNFVGEYSTVLFRGSALLGINPRDILIYGDQPFTKGLGDVVAYWNVVQQGKAVYLDRELSYFRKDPAHESLSNPKTNENFSFAISDWADLSILLHQEGIVSDQELKERAPRLLGMLVNNEKKWPALGSAKERFLEYIEKKGIVQ
jgi:glycosyltransferase involved in cell wall biosynthesis